MPPTDRSRPPTRRRSVLTFEGLEDRRLMSVAVPAHPRHVHVVHALAGTGLGGGGGSGQGVPDLGPPTRNEAIKERFVAKLVGTFVTAPGRFQNQPLQALVLATGGSNQALHMIANFQFFENADPAFPPTGQINLTTRDAATTGTSLLLDLKADPHFTSHGLPTHFNYTVNTGSSAGTYSNATGQGILDIHYLLNGRPSGVHSAGRAIVVVQGTVVTNHGLTLDIASPGNRTANP